MIKLSEKFTKKTSRQKNHIFPAVFLLVIIPFCLNQPSHAEKNNPFISRIEDKITATIIINESPIKVWETLINYKETGEKMPDIKQVKLIKDNSNYKIIEHTYKAPYTFGQNVTAIIKVQENPNIIISYQLIKSNSIKTLEGFWIINPTKDGTLLTHSINLEPKLPRFLKPYFLNLFESNLEKSMNTLKGIILEN